MVSAKHIACLEIVLDTHDGLLGNLGHVESHFGLFADSANLDARLVHGLRQKYHRLRNHFWMHVMVLLGDKASGTSFRFVLEIMLTFT
jgi:hypothetical protein